MGNMTYNVSEIFRSIQGEGYHTGRPAVFVRLAGCNLQCPWCDTDHTTKEVLSEHELKTRVNTILHENDHLIVFTGGEPTLQNLSPFIHCWDPLTLAVETNGTLPEELKQYKKQAGLKDNCFWITMSPKIDFIQRESLMLADEIKVVYDKDMPFEKIAANARYSLLHSPGRLFIQPESGMVQPALDYVMKHPWWRLSLQTHKLIGVR